MTLMMMMLGDGHSLGDLDVLSVLLSVLLSLSLVDLDVDLVHLVTLVSLAMVLYALALLALGGRWKIKQIKKCNGAYYVCNNLSYTHNVYQSIVT